MNMVRPKHECERRCAVLVVQTLYLFLSLYILEKIVLDLVLKQIDFISEDRPSIFLARYTVGQALLATATFAQWEV